MPDDQQVVRRQHGRGRRLAILVVSALLCCVVLVFGLYRSAPGDLILTSEQCRNEGQVEALGKTWKLAEAAPGEWEDLNAVPGTVRNIRFTGWAYFESGGVELSLAAPGAPTNFDCPIWPSRVEGG